MENLLTWYESFRTVAQGVYLKENRYKHFLSIKNKVIT